MATRRARADGRSAGRRGQKSLPAQPAPRIFLGLGHAKVEADEARDVRCHRARRRASWACQTRAGGSRQRGSRGRGAVASSVQELNVPTPRSPPRKPSLPGAQNPHQREPRCRKDLRSPPWVVRSPPPALSAAALSSPRAPPQAGACCAPGRGGRGRTNLGEEVTDPEMIPPSRPRLSLPPSTLPSSLASTPVEPATLIHRFTPIPSRPDPAASFLWRSRASCHRQIEFGSGYLLWP